MKKIQPTQEEIDAYNRQRYERRMPGNKRLRMMRAAALFSAAVKAAKAEAAKRKAKRRRLDDTEKR